MVDDLDEGHHRRVFGDQSIELGVNVLNLFDEDTPIYYDNLYSESSVELGSQYLERLGLREYLEQNHLLKFGLRFYPGGGHLPLEQRTEIGPSSEPIVQSYQIDRGIFETDLRAMLVEDGVTLLEGHTVSEVELGDGSVSVALWGKNLTDEEYIVHGANFNFFRAYTWGSPRSVGVDLSYEF